MLFLGLAFSAIAIADDAETAEDDTLAPYRLPFDVLAERAIGTTSRPVEFNWRRTKVHLAASGNHLFELNNFNSMRAGVMARFPAERIIVEVGASYTFVWDSRGSELLAFTPYRQPGRPDRVELDFTLGVPLAEGVVTTFPGFFPAVELVFNAYAGLRYALYPTGFQGMRVREIGSALFSPTLTEMEEENLDEQRLTAMQLDPGRYGLMIGFGNDIYFKQGVFLSPRLMLAVPLLAPATETDLLFWADISLSVGIAL